MAQPYVGEIRMFAGNFAPAGWAFCDGSLLPISEYETLFQLIGTTYGGDGQQTYAVPDMRGRLPVHMGQGPGIGSNYIIGQTGGSESVTLTNNQIPAHNHLMLVSGTAASASSPQGNSLANATANLYLRDTPSDTMNAASINNTGGSQPHENMMPYLCVSFIISLFGIYPSPT
ncbi:phage tail protein [Lacihabitans soyangensis]|uniref:Phage tail protein n=1 Tax=Lacihabitans soyangensis TaxID=869394 RepID=A0AAE3H3A7_9BACT|nr:tail fiber protein [Lacihabitans soyangensis]MCP9763286.1 phage tail protein [Lacihabitans soyangensis]